MRMLWLLLALLIPASASSAEQTLTVGSKRFTESYILGEILAQRARGTHKPGARLCGRYADAPACAGADQPDRRRSAR